MTDINEVSIDNNPDSIMRNVRRSVKRNPWMMSTVVFAIIALILLIMNFNGGVTGNVISADDAGQKIVDFAEAQGVSAELVAVNDTGSFYEVIIAINGQDMPIYVTKDGDYMAQALIPLNAVKEANANTKTPAPANVPKTDKPVVELYVFTYCPYGTQSEKGIIPVAKLLGDKIDFKIRQIGAMHGEYEKIEAQRQLCIEKLYPAKFLDYVLDFALDKEVGNCNGDATCVNPLIEKLYTKLGIDKAKIESCMKTDGVTLYAAEEKNSGDNGVSGSPTLIINGEKANSGRDSASYLAAICNAFTTAPAECDQALSSASPSPGFGSSTSSSSSSASC